MFFLLVKAEQSNDDAARTAQGGCQRGSSWRLDASSPQKQVDVVEVVVGRKGVCEREKRISGSRQASACGLYFWCVVCCALCMHSCARRRDPTLSSLPESRHTGEAMPTALSAQPFFCTRLPYAPIRDAPQQYSSLTRANTTQGILSYIRPTPELGHAAYITRLDMLLVNTTDQVRSPSRLLPLYP